MLKTGLNILLLCLPFFAFAEEVKIYGTAPDYAGQTLRLYTYEDFATYTQTKLGQTEIAEDGSFSIRGEVSGTSLLTLRIGWINASLFAEPGGAYKITFPALPKDVALSMANTTFVDLEFDSIDTQMDINALISQYNVRYEQFFAANYEAMARGRFKTQLDSFKVALDAEFARAKDNQFFTDYRTYSLAAVEQLTNNMAAMKKGRLNLFDQYLKDKPVLYNNPEYFNFIEGFFGSYFIRYMTQRGSQLIVKAVNDTPNFSLLQEAASKDDFVADPKLRELMIVQGLGGLFHDKRFKRDHVLALLDSAEQQAKYPENKLIAQRMRQQLTNLSVGYAAPDFQLTDAEGESVSLSQFKGKYVYLGFFADWCKPCMLDLQLLPDMHEKYGKDVVFINISLDKDEKVFDYVLEAHPEYDWTFLHFNDDQDLISSYAIRSLPSYFLIDTEGNLMQSPALSPTPNGTNHSIDESLHNIYMKLHPVKGSGVGNRQNDGG